MCSPKQQRKTFLWFNPAVLCLWGLAQAQIYAEPMGCNSAAISDFLELQLVPVGCQKLSCDHWAPLSLTVTFFILWKEHLPPNNTLPSLSVLFSPFACLIILKQLHSSFWNCSRLTYNMQYVHLLFWECQLLGRLNGPVRLPSAFCITLFSVYFLDTHIFFFSTYFFWKLNPNTFKSSCFKTVWVFYSE